LNALSAATNGLNRYTTILDEAWQAHLAKRKLNAPTVISIFAGAGGSSLGYSMAGYQELLAVEWDNNAVETFKLNFPNIPVYHSDIVGLSIEKCLQLAKIESGELDVLDGSPPCQGFSIAGKRIINDPRNQLFHEYTRLLCGLRPKVFVMENVSGMIKGKMKLIFAEVIRELKASNYQVSARLMNTIYFNVPQLRQRIIFIGVREDLEIKPSHPKAESRVITYQDATKSIIGLSPNRKIIKQERYKNAKEGQPLYSTYTYSYRRLSRWKPSGTITKGSHQIHPVEDRELNGRELARLSSYPDTFQFLGGHQDWVDRIGNSVPPLFMRAIAQHIRTEILERIEHGETKHKARGIVKAAR